MKWNLLVSEGGTPGVMDLLHFGHQIRSATTDPPAGYLLHLRNSHGQE
jgi:hypothetical protein